MLGLRDLQERFFRSIAAVPGPSASQHFDAGLLQLIEGRDRLGPADRLDIYAQMYWARLHDVLVEDFPRVAALLGPDRFATVTRTYLARRPSTHPSVRHVGAGFAGFLADEGVAPEAPFLADLARLEWARLDVFDAPDAKPIGVADLREVVPEEWPLLTFQPVPALRLLQTAWPVHELWAAVDEGRVREPVRSEETHLRVWREGFMVYQATMDPRERLALARVSAGEPFAEMCTALESMMSAGEAAREAAQLLLRWLEDGILGGARMGERDVRASSRN